mmetsp:Transcript_34239/g.61768  ORF Transcript_34239/g.61768 Transcript_34239/m.61768 type:complete len:210 (-) Transcript_34239:187-816(-)
MDFQVMVTLDDRGKLLLNTILINIGLGLGRRRGEIAAACTGNATEVVANDWMVTEDSLHVNIIAFVVEEAELLELASDKKIGNANVIGTAGNENGVLGTNGVSKPYISQITEGLVKDAKAVFGDLLIRDQTKARSKDLLVNKTSGTKTNVVLEPMNSSEDTGMSLGVLGKPVVSNVEPFSQVGQNGTTLGKKEVLGLVFKKRNLAKRIL